MSVIRQPRVLGRTTQRRLVGLTSALSAAAVEAFAVGTWFALVGVGSRSAFTALAGLGVLLFGSLLRTGVIGALEGGRAVRSAPMRVATAILLAGCWVGWLLTAEQIGGVAGVLVAGALLATTLSIQFALERRLYFWSPIERVADVVVRGLAPAFLAATGATLLLAGTWFVDWTVPLATIPLGDLTVRLEVGGLVVGFACYGACSFLAQQRRASRVLTG